MKKSALVTMVKWLEIWSEDCATLSSFLNQFGPMKGRFKEAPLPPRTSERSAETSLARAATLLDNMARNNAQVACFLGAQPTDPEPQELGDSDLLRLITHWQALLAGVFTGMLRLYGVRPVRGRLSAQLEALDENELCAEIVRWLEKSATDAVEFARTQGIGFAPVPASIGTASSRHQSLVSLERAIRRLTTDCMQIAALLPYHRVFHMKSDIEPGDEVSEGEYPDAKEPVVEAPPDGR